MRYLIFVLLLVSCGISDGEITPQTDPRGKLTIDGPVDTVLILKSSTEDNVQILDLNREPLYKLVDDDYMKDQGGELAVFLGILIILAFIGGCITIATYY